LEESFRDLSKSCQLDYDDDANQAMHEVEPRVSDCSLIVVRKVEPRVNDCSLILVREVESRVNDCSLIVVREVEPRVGSNLRVVCYLSQSQIYGMIKSRKCDDAPFSFRL
jgi:hypothetical protein